MLTVPLLLAALLCSAENDEAPARGSVRGPWALVDLSAFSSGQLTPGRVPLDTIGGSLALVGGLGFELAGVRFSPTARFSIGPQRYLGNFYSTIGWSPVALAIAAPDLINETKFTGLRLTPILGITIPTTRGAFDGDVPFTVASLAAQLERRFGVFELAYRLEGNSAPCLSGTPSVQTTGIAPSSIGCEASWGLLNRIFAEAWIRKSLSVALGLQWSMNWLVVPGLFSSPYCPAGTICDFDNILRQRVDAASVEGRVTWAFAERFGSTFEFGLVHSPSVSPFFPPITTVAASLSLWFRTDPVLERNWLDR